MDLRNCVVCGTMFQYTGDKVCPNCKKKLEDKLQDVKQYLKEHKMASVSQVSEDMDVSVKVLRRWVKEERLMFAPGVDTGLVCSRCGVPISSGTMCDKCRKEVSDNLIKSDKTDEPAPKRENVNNKVRMHLSKYK